MIKKTINVLFVLLVNATAINAQNPMGYTAERIDGSGATLNLKNINGFWHFSGPRSYETHNKLSLFWNDGTYHRILSINDDGKVGIGTSSPGSKLDVAGSLNGTEYITVSRSGSYRVAMNGQGHGYLTGRNDNAESKFLIHSNGSTYFNGGNVGVGTANPDSKLTVKGDIHAQEVKVDLNGAVAPDYVFKEDYDLKSLEEVQSFIKENGHLPNIPSAQEMEKNGIQLGEMNMKLLEKIEELTLYLIELKKENTAMRTELNQIKNTLN